MLADQVAQVLQTPRCTVSMKPLLVMAANFVHDRLVLRERRSVIDMQMIAERFVFDKNPARIVHYLKSISGGSLTDTLVLESAQLPASPAWIEMPVDFGRVVRGPAEQHGRVGYMVETLRDGEIVMSIVSRPDGALPLIMGCLTMDMPVRVGTTTFKVHSWHSHGGDPRTLPSQEIQEDCQHYVLDFVEACFLLQMPKLTETRHVAHDQRLQKSRVRKGKRPFLEYRKVSVLIDVPTVHYVRDEDPRVAREQTERELGLGGGGHKKYHRVLPHARTYKDEDGRVRDVVPIPQHWRGDPKRGIIIHEKRIGQRGGENA